MSAKLADSNLTRGWKDGSGAPLAPPCRAGALIPPLIACLLLLTACVNPFAPTGTEGSLSVSVSNTINARTLVPGIQMEAASFTVTGTGPNSATFGATTTGAAVTVSGLSLGTWTVVVNALNSTGTVIGTGSETALVSGGRTTTIPITVKPVTGTGILSLTVTWPAGQVTNPSIAATLTPVLGTAQDLDFSISGSTATYSDASIANGYYTLAFTLDNNGVPASGAVEIVRVVTGQTTSGTYAFANVNQPGGTLVVDVGLNLANPLEVTISGASATMAAGSTQSLTASVSAYTGNVNYVWYVNGTPVTVGPSCSFGSGSLAGFYRVDVIAFAADGFRAGSATTLIQVESSGSPQGVPVDSDTVALWRLDEAHADDNAIDAAGNYALQQFGSPSAVDGHIDGGRRTGGSSKYFQGHGDAALGSVFNGNWTFEAWVYVDDTLTSDGILLMYNGLAFSLVDSDAVLASIVLMQNRSIRWTQWQSSSSEMAGYSSGTLQSGRFNHVAVTRSAQGGNLYTFRIYINGALDTTVTDLPGLSYAVTGEDHSIGLGCYTDISGFGNGTCVLDGILDDVRISKVARSDAEILQDYQRGQ
jgi:hypothetical protein